MAPPARTSGSGRGRSGTSPGSSPRAAKDAGCLVALGPGEVELDGAYTFRTFRGNGLLSVVEREILRDAKRDGAHVAYTHVEADNVASIKGVLKTGFTPHGLVTFSRLLGWTRTRWEPITPTAPISTPATHAR